MKISIVTPVYNGERYIRRTIESVLAQDINDLEYIIVDGASSDATLKIINEYKDKISLVISEPDNGMYDAINKGFRSASGDIFAYLNSDDLYAEGALKLVIEVFLNNSIDFYFGGCEYIDPDDRIIFRNQGVNLSYKNVCRLGRMPFAQQATFWSRNMHERIGGFDESYKYVADTKFFLQCLKMAGSKKHFTNEYLAKFRLHDEAFSTVAAAAMRIEHHRVWQEENIKLTVARYFIEAFVKWRNRRNLFNKYVVKSL